MRKTKLYNNVSESLIKDTKLKPGEVVTYRLLNIERNPMDPSRLAMPAHKNVPPVDSVWDEAKGEFVDVAAVRSVDANGSHTFIDIFFTKQNHGYLMLTGGKAEDQEIHTYLSICNYNRSNPNRDVSKPAIFELVDEAKKAEAASRTRNIRRQALNAAADMDLDALKLFVLARGGDETRKQAVLRDEVEAFADSDPEEFMRILNDSVSKVKALINKAVQTGAVRFNAEQSRYEWPQGEVILVVARGDEAVEEFANFLTASAKGEKVLKTIESKLRPKPSGKTVEEPAKQ